MSRDNVTDLPDRDHIDHDDQLLDRAGSTDPAANDAVALLRDLAIEGTR